MNTDAPLAALATDGVADEIERLRAQLLGESARLQAVATATVDSAEDLARQARASRQTMRAVTPPSAKAASVPPEPASGDLTKRFQALR
jgi:hypothetical protein